MGRWLAAALVAAGMAVAGTAGPAASPDGCANLGLASHERSPLHGDVTGDGRSDRVAVVEDRRAPFRCRYALAIFSRGQRTVFPLGRFADNPAQLVGPQPLVRLLARIDSHRGAEILLALTHGASFEQSWLFTVRHGRLRRLSLPRSYQGELEYGSFAASGRSFDCLSRGSGVIFDAWYTMLDSQGHRWQYGLTRYRVADLKLRFAGARTVTVPRYQAPRWWRRYYNERDPFSRCTVAAQPTPS